MPGARRSWDLTASARASRRGAAAVTSPGSSGPGRGFAEGVQKFTPFYWGEATEILKSNATWQPAAVFLGLFAGFLALAVSAFERRDFAVGGWSPGATLRRMLWRAGGHETDSAGPATHGAQVKGS
jgi:hypothetical protein